MKIEVPKFEKFADLPIGAMFIRPEIGVLMIKTSSSAAIAVGGERDTVGNHIKVLVVKELEVVT